MKVKIDKDKCIGCGVCVTIAPKSFQLGVDGKAEVIEPPTSPSQGGPGDDEVKIKEAVDSCPVQAIELLD